MRTGLKVLLFSGLAVLALLIGAYFTAPYWLEWTLKGYFASQGSHLSFSRVEWQGQSITITDVLLEREQDSYQMTLSAPEVRADLSFSPVFALDLALDKPFLTLSHPEEGKTVELKTLSESVHDGFFTPQLRVKMRDGFLVLDEESPKVWKRAFQGEISLQKGLVSGNLAIKEAEGGFFELTMTQGEGGMKTTLRVQKFMAVDMLKLTEFMSQTSAKVAIKAGVVTGLITLARHPGERVPLVSGKMVVEDLLVTQPSTEIEADIPKLRVHLMPLAFPRTPDSSDFWAELLASTACEAQIVGGSSISRFREKAPYWIARSVTGHLSLNGAEECTLHAILDGQFFFKEDHEALFSMNFCYPLLHQDPATLELSLKAGGDLPVSLNASFVPSHMTVSLVNVGAREFEVARDFMGDLSSLYEETHIEAGRLSTEFSIETRELLNAPPERHITIRSLKAEDLAFAVPAFRIHGRVVSLSGAGELFLNKGAKPLYVQKGMAALQGGDFYWTAGGEISSDFEHIKHVNGAITIEDGQMKGARLAGTVADITGSLVFYGLQEKMLDFKAEGPIASLSPLLGAQVEKGSRKFSLMGSMNKTAFGLNVESSLSLLGNKPGRLTGQLQLKRLLRSSVATDPVLWQRWGISLLSSNHPQASFGKVLHLKWLKDRAGSYYLSLDEIDLKAESIELASVVPLEAGTLSASLQIHPRRKGSSWDAGFHVQEIDVQNLAFSQEGVKVFAGAVTGTFAAHINDKKQFLYVDSADLKIAEGRVEAGPVTIQEFMSSFAVSEGLVKDCSLTGKVGGLHIGGSFSGLKPEGEIAAITAKGDPTELLKALGLNASAYGYVSCMGHVVAAEKGLRFDTVFSDKGGTFALRADLDRLALADYRGETRLWCKWGGCLYDLAGYNETLFGRAYKIPLLKDASGGFVVRLASLSLSVPGYTINETAAALLQEWTKTKILGTVKAQVKVTDQALQAGFGLSQFSLQNKEGLFAGEELGGYDRDKRSWQGVFLKKFGADPTLQAPFKGVHYHNAALNLDFDHARGQLRVKGPRLSIQNIQAISKGLFLAGQVDIDLEKDEGYGLVIKTSRIEGEAAAAQAFGLQFAEMPILRYPSSGQITSADGGFLLQGFVPYGPDKADMQWALKGTTIGVGLTVNHLQLSQIQSQFTYDSEKKRLTVDLKEANLKALTDEYVLVDSALDMNWQRGLAGQLIAKASQAGDRVLYSEVGLSFFTENEDINIAVSHDSYFGGLRFMADKIVLDSSWALTVLKGQSAWQMYNFFDDSARLLQLVGQKADFSALKESTRLGGSVKIDCDFENHKVKASLAGKSFKVAGKEVEPFTATLEGSAEQIELTALHYRDLLVTASAHTREGVITIDEIKGLRPGLDFSGTGQFTIATRELLLSLNHMAIDLASIEYTKKWQTLAAVWQPEGHVVVVGSLQAGFSGDNDFLRWRASAVTEGLVLRGNRLQTSGPVNLSYDNKGGLKIGDLTLTMKRAGPTNYLATIGVKGAHYNGETGSLSIDDIAFAFPTNYIREVILLGEQLLPSLFDETTRRLFNDVKRDGGLMGNVELDLASEQLRVKIRLSDGTYSFAGRSLALQNVTLDYSERGVELGAHYRFNKALIDMRLISKAPEYGKGQFHISLAGQPRSVNNLIVCDWVMQKEEGLVLQKVQGAAFGLQVALTGAANAAQQTFGGAIKLANREALLPLLPETLQAFLTKWQMNAGYIVRGQWWLDKTLLEHYRFKGHLAGEQMRLLGNTLEQALGELAFEEGLIELHNFRIIDPAVRMDIPALILTKKGEESWAIKMNLLQISNLRLADLKRAEPVAKRLRSVIIPRAALRDLQGDLSHVSTLTGYGDMSFDKIKSSSIGSQLMSIPGDILGRLGLNLSVLSPASGSIDFVIENRRVLITKMRDVYSDGEMSRFYLPKSSTPSYIDFDGNLNITLRMKQYNLLLKLAEALSINVTGKWDDPSYSLKKSP